MTTRPREVAPLDPTETLALHAELGGLELREYLGLLWPDVARRTIVGLFANGRLRSGGRPVSSRALVREIEDLTLHGAVEDLPRIPCPSRLPAGQPEILHEDRDIIVLAKPSGTPVIPDRGRDLHSCLGWLIRKELDRRPRARAEGFLRHRIVHRLDRLTSGVLIVAKSAPAERRLAADFEARRIRKEYLAILQGTLEPARVTVNCPVIPGRKGTMRARGGRSLPPATTSFEVIARSGGLTLARARPVTGRTHQIRVHAWVLGHPLAIDPLYGRKGSAGAGGLSSMRRLTLHALRYTLAGDWPGPRTLLCPPPPDFEAEIRRLGGAGVLVELGLDPGGGRPVSR